MTRYLRMQKMHVFSVPAVPNQGRFLITKVKTHRNIYCGAIEIFLFKIEITCSKKLNWHVRTSFKQVNINRCWLLELLLRENNFLYTKYWLPFFLHIFINISFPFSSHVMLFDHFLGLSSSFEIDNLPSLPHNLTYRECQKSQPMPQFLAI